MDSVPSILETKQSLNDEHELVPLPIDNNDDVDITDNTNRSGHETEDEPPPPTATMTEAPAPNTANTANAPNSEGPEALSLSTISPPNVWVKSEDHNPSPPPLPVGGDAVTVDPPSSGPLSVSGSGSMATVSDATSSVPQPPIAPPKGSGTAASGTAQCHFAGSLSTSTSTSGSAAVSAPSPYAHRSAMAVARHLNEPPPLTPQSDIARNGDVISMTRPRGQPLAATNGSAAVKAEVPSTRSVPFSVSSPQGQALPAPPPPPPPDQGMSGLFGMDFGIEIDGNLPSSIPPKLLIFGACPSASGYSLSFAPPPPPPPVPGPNGFGGDGASTVDGVGYGVAIEYRCKLCRLLFNTKHELIRHKRSMHPSAAQPQSAPTRGRRGRGGGGSANGNGNAMGRAPRFHCNICNRSFGGKQHFEYHQRTHSGEKPFQCPTCGKAFRAKHSLKNHIRIHTGERPYQCKQCGKWFRQLGVMKNHIKNMHSNPLHHDIPGQHRAAMAPPNAPPPPNHSITM